MIANKHRKMLTNDTITIKQQTLNNNGLLEFNFALVRCHLIIRNTRKMRLGMRIIASK